MDKIRILIADQNADARAEIKAHAECESMTVEEAADGITALKLFRRNKIDLVIIDADIPELDAYNICRQIRKSSKTPIIITSSRNDEEEALSFYEIGVDDFIAKPVSGRIMAARINVIMLRNNSVNYEPRRLIFDGLCIDSVSNKVYVDGENVSLTPKEYKLLLFFARNPHKAMDRETILRNVWGEDFFGTDRTVDSHIRMLRKHIKPYGKLIDTVWGVGYLFK